MKKVYQHLHGNFQCVNAPRKHSRQHPGSTVEFHGETVCIIVDHVDVFYDTYSSKKFDVPGLSNGTADRRYYDFHSSGTKQCLEIYNVIGTQEDLSDSKTLIYKGLANAFEEYAQHITMFESSTSTSVQVTEDKRSNVAPTRMLDHMGGFEKILEFIKTASAENKNTVQVEMYHCLAAAIDAYSKESAHGETEVVSKLIDSGILPDLGTAMLEGNSSSKSLPYILKPFKQFGRAPLVQQTVREKGVLGRISDLLMSNDEKVQS